MRLRRLPGDGGGPGLDLGGDLELELDDEADRVRLRELLTPPAGPRTRVNLVIAADGSTAGPDGTSASLTGGADRRMLGALRALADVVLVGAATFRAEPGLVPRRTRLAVLSRSGELPPPPIAAPIPPLLLAPREVADRIRAGRDDVEALAIAHERSVDGVLDALRGRGLAHVLCEGGPRLARQLVEHGLVDDVHVTLAPVASGTGLRWPWAADPPPGFVPVQRFADDAGYRYAVFTRDPASPAARSGSR